MDNKANFQIDDKDFPFVTVRINDTMTEDFNRFLLERWTGWLQQNKPFCMLHFYGGSDSRQSAAVKKMRKRWIKENRPLVKKNMAGLAMVVKSKAILEKMRLMVGKENRRVFGCPRNVFSWEEEAMAKKWLQKQMDAFQKSSI